LENFTSLATAILQAPVKKKKKQTKNSASQGKPRKSDRDWNGSAFCRAGLHD